MTIDEVYEQNKKVHQKEAEEKKAEQPPIQTAPAPEPKPVDTIRGFLEKNSLSRSDTIPKLTVTDELSSDDVVCVLLE